MLGGRGGALIAFFVVAAHNGDFFPVHHPCFSWILYLGSARLAFRHGERCKPPQPVRGHFSPLEYVTRALVIPGRVDTPYTPKTRTDLV
jgi:hypothetical protein